MRERARQPYSVYDQLVKPEVTLMEADRWLTYEKCIGCHLKSPLELQAQKTAQLGRGWWPRSAATRKVKLSDDGGKPHCALF